MMDFTPKPSAEWSANFEGIIDRAMQAKQQAEPPRKYLGASRIGDDCLRKLAMEYHHVPKDPDAHFKGKTLRVFERGHDGETRMADRLRLAGFGLVTERPDGRQIGFGVAWDEDRQSFRVAGNCDGVITSAPYESGLVCPAKGVRASKPVYFVQMQLYMAYLDLTANPGVFTAENGDTGEIYAERVPFDAAVAQAASDKAVKIVQTQSPEEMPRVAKDATDFRCKWCDYAGTCWQSQPSQPAPPTGAWAFGTGASA